MNNKYHFKKSAMRNFFFPLRSNRGVTLVELLVALGISVLLFASVFTVNLMARQTFEFSANFVDVHGGTRMGMDWMAKDVRWANQILSSIVIGSDTYTTADDELVLEIPSIDNSGIVIEGTSDYVVYHLNASDETILERIIDADATSSRSDETRTISNNVNTIAFSSNGTGLGSIVDVTSLTQVEVNLTTQKTALSGKVVNDDLNSVIELRND